MNLLILSDLHLAHQGFAPVREGQRIDAQDDVVVLAGDIHDGVAGLRWGRETFPDKPIVYVAGNHEFYGFNWTHHVDSMREAARSYDIEFLETDAVELAGVRFLGCTLWTDFDLLGADKRTDALRLARSSINDYQFIQISRTAEIHWANSWLLMPSLTLHRHEGSVAWLASRLADQTDPEKTVIVTHHAPHPTSIPVRYADDLLAASYASDLTRLMGQARLWIHGHVHHSVDYVVNGTRVVANPRGYPHKSGGMENDAFSPVLIVEI